MMIDMIRLQTRAIASRFVKNEEGVTAIEYAVLAAALAAIVGLAIGSDTSSGLGKNLKDAFDGIFTK